MICIIIIQGLKKHQSWQIYAREFTTIISYLNTHMVICSVISVKPCATCLSPWSGLLYDAQKKLTFGDVNFIHQGQKSKIYWMKFWPMKIRELTKIIVPPWFPPKIETYSSGSVFCEIELAVHLIVIQLSNATLIVSLLLCLALHPPLLLSRILFHKNKTLAIHYLSL